MTAAVRLPLPPSLYADTPLAKVPTASLNRDKSVSVAMVGADFTGLSTALHLAELGAEAVALEAQEAGGGGWQQTADKSIPDSLLTHYAERRAAVAISERGHLDAWLEQPARNAQWSWNSDGCRQGPGLPSRFARRPHLAPAIGRRGTVPRK
jgi:hypothetical protein